MERTISDPLQSDAASVLFGSVVLACGLLLLTYLLRSVRVTASSAVRPETPPIEKHDARPISRRVVASVKAPPPPRSFHRFYVDETRISR